VSAPHLPDPIANPTSAFLSAGESLTPSPVMPTTRPVSCGYTHSLAMHTMPARTRHTCASRTSRLLSVGSARDTTASLGSIFFTSSSDIALSCLGVGASRTRTHAHTHLLRRDALALVVAVQANIARHRVGRLLAIAGDHHHLNAGAATARTRMRSRTRAHNQHATHHDSTAPRDSGRVSSRMATAPSRMRSVGSARAWQCGCTRDCHSVNA
jgi:hypothetical protein